MVIYVDYLYCRTSNKFFKSDFFRAILQKLFWSSSSLIYGILHGWTLSSVGKISPFFFDPKFFCEAKAARVAISLPSTGKEWIFSFMSLGEGAEFAVPVIENGLSKLW